MINTMINTMTEKVRCIKCGYEWIPRKDPEEIRECPECKTRKWRGER